LNILFYFINNCILKSFLFFIIDLKKFFFSLSFSLLLGGPIELNSRTHTRQNLTQTNIKSRSVCLVEFNTYCFFFVCYLRSFRAETLESRYTSYYASNSIPIKRLHVSIRKKK
jgi:hypothetical protein